jgi:hypothetical protein
MAITCHRWPQQPSINAILGVRNQESYTGHKFPCHSTHSLQPLDVGIFGPLSTAYLSELHVQQQHSQGLLLVKSQISTGYSSKLGLLQRPNPTSKLLLKPLVYGHKIGRL